MGGQDQILDVLTTLGTLDLSVFAYGQVGLRVCVRVDIQKSISHVMDDMRQRKPCWLFITVSANV